MFKRYLVHVPASGDIHSVDWDIRPIPQLTNLFSNGYYIFPISGIMNISIYFENTDKELSENVTMYSIYCALLNKYLINDPKKLAKYSLFVSKYKFYGDVYIIFRNVEKYKFIKDYFTSPFKGLSFSQQPQQKSVNLGLVGQGKKGHFQWF